MSEPAKCYCGGTIGVEVFEMRPGTWCVHCRDCWEGTLGFSSLEKAIEEWNAMMQKEAEYSTKTNKGEG